MRERDTDCPGPDTEVPSNEPRGGAFEEELRGIFRNVVRDELHANAELSQIPALTSAVRGMTAEVVALIECVRHSDSRVDQIRDYLDELRRDLERQGIVVPRLELRAVPPLREGDLRG